MGGTAVVHMSQLGFERAYPQRKTRRRGFVSPIHLRRQSLDPLLSVPAGVNPFRFGAEHAEAQALRLSSLPATPPPPADARKQVITKEKRLHPKKAQWLAEQAALPPLMRLPGADVDLPSNASDQARRKLQHTTWLRWREYRRNRG